jgi:hypothetical protein
MSDTEKPKPDPIPVLLAEPGADERPTFYVIGDNFHAVTSDGMIVVPLRFKTGLFKKVMAAQGDNLELFLLLVDGIGNEDTIAQLDELDIYESMPIAIAYFRAWKERQDASMGEAQRSSN